LGAESRFIADSGKTAGSHRAWRNLDPLTDQRYWLYAAVDPETNEFLHFRPY